MAGILQTAFLVKQGDSGSHIGIVAVAESDWAVRLEVATRAWGTASEYKELDAFELMRAGREGYPIFCCAE